MDMMPLPQKIHEKVVGFFKVLNFLEEQLLGVFFGF
jgi:hypothetical protein